MHFFFFNDTATTEIYTLSLHDALPICTDRAETMLLALSTFFRSTLSLDPTADVTLAEEIDLQRLYLDIEKARFPDRLQVEIDVPAELEQVRLPALVLQPIVENAIKYGVSTTRKT